MSASVKLLAALAVAAAGLVLGGMVILRDRAQDRADAAIRLELPAFEMVYELMQADGVHRHRLVYEGRNQWRETLEASTAFGADLERSQEIRAGVYTSTVHGSEHVSVADLNAAFIPWRWFNTPDSTVRRGAARNGGEVVSSLNGDERLIVVTLPDTVERHYFHEPTGILSITWRSIAARW